MSERKPIILCGGAQGRAVIFGYVDEEPTPGTPAVLFDARMVLRWDSACGGLFGLAAGGPKGATKVTAIVAKVVDTDWKQCLAVSTEAAKALSAWAAV